MKLSIFTRMASIITSFLLGYQDAEQTEEYILTTITEDDVPLGPKIPVEQLFPYAVVAIIVVIIFFLASVYIMKCQKYRVRINVLRSEMLPGMKPKVKNCWNLRELKRQTSQLEKETVEIIMKQQNDL